MFFRKKTAFAKNAIAQDLRSVRRSAIRTMFLVVLLVSGVAPAMCMWWDFRGDVPYQQQLASFCTVALRTYPLTLSIAIIAMSRQLGWFRYGRIFFMAAVITAGASLGDLVSNVTGIETYRIEASNTIATPDNAIFGPLINSFNYLVGYYNLYGARHFLASILVGSFAGRTASKLIKHVPERERIYEYLAELVEDEKKQAA